MLTTRQPHGALMAFGPAQEAKQRALTVSALKRLADNQVLSGRALFPGAWKRDNWAYKLLRRMVTAGLLKQLGTRPIEYFPAEEGILDQFLEDEDELTWLVWPGQRPPPVSPVSEYPSDEIVDAERVGEDEEEEPPTDRQLLEANLKLSSALLEHAQAMSTSLEGVRNELAALRQLWE